MRAEGRSGRTSWAALTLRNHGEGPWLALPAPDRVEYDGRPLSFEGRVADSAAERSSTREVSELRWELSGREGLHGTVAFHADGRFRLELPTEGLGERTLRLVAEDWNRNRTEWTVRLLEGERGREAPAVAAAPPAAPLPVPPPSLPAASPVPAPTRATAPAVTPQPTAAPAAAIAPQTAFAPAGTAAPIQAPAALEAPPADPVAKAVPPVTPPPAAQPSPAPAAPAPAPQPEAAPGARPPAGKAALLITSPADRSAYGARVPGDRLPAPPAVAASVSLEVQTAEANRDSRAVRLALPLDAEGGFQGVFSTDGMIGTQSVVVRGEDGTGRRLEASITLLPGDSGIPSFLAEPGDGQAGFRWDPVPLTGEYSLFYILNEAAAAAEPAPGSAEEIRGVRSPFLLSNLENGRLYSFRLRAATPGQPEVWSSTRALLPLSPLTLLPAVSSEYAQVRLSWAAIRGAEGYELWRATALDGTYESIGGPLTGTIYVDRSVAFGRRYYYKVRPLLAGAAFSLAAAGEASIVPPRRLDLQGSLAAASPRSLTVNGEYVYLASGKGGLLIIDVHDPSAPVQVGALTDCDPRDVAAQGDYLYLADGQRGLVVVDVSEPRKPVATGARGTDDPQGIAVLGGVAVVADGSGGIKVFDVTSPYKPNRIATLDTADARRAVLRGATVFLADAREGLLAVDLSTPAAPVRLASLPAAGAVDLSLSGDLAFAACGEAGVLIADISDPARPERIGAVEGLQAESIAAGPGFACVTEKGRGMRLLDVTDPRRAAAVEGLEAPGAGRVAVSRDRAFLLDGESLKVVHLEVIGRSFPVGGLRIEGAAPCDVRLAGGLAFVSGRQGGVQLVDITRPAAVGEGSVVATLRAAYAEGVDLDGDLALVADGTLGIKLFDLDPLRARGKGEPPAALAPLAEYRPPGRVFAAALKGNLAWLAAGERGLLAVSLQDRRNLVEVGGFGTADARDVAVRGDTLLLADGKAGLKLLDLAEPLRPVLAGSLRLAMARRVAVRGDSAFVVGSAGLTMVDIRRPGRRRWSRCTRAPTPRTCRWTAGGSTWRRDTAG